MCVQCVQCVCVVCVGKMVPRSSACAVWCAARQALRRRAGAMECLLPAKVTRQPGCKNSALQYARCYGMSILRGGGGYARHSPAHQKNGSPPARA